MQRSGQQEAAGCGLHPDDAPAAWCVLARPATSAVRHGRCAAAGVRRRTVCTPEMALTTVDLPCATWPMVPAVGAEVRSSGIQAGGKQPWPLQHAAGNAALAVTQAPGCASEASAPAVTHTNVDGGLPRDDLGRQRCEFGHIKGAQVLRQAGWSGVSGGRQAAAAPQAWLPGGNAPPAALAMRSSLDKQPRLACRGCQRGERLPSVLGKPACPADRLTCSLSPLPALLAMAATAVLPAGPCLPRLLPSLKQLQRWC